MFSETIRALTRGHNVQIVVLAELRFASLTMFVHNEGGLLQSKGFDGQIEAIEWKGLQGRAQVSTLGASRLGQSRQIVCTLNVHDDQLRSWAFEADQAELKGRPMLFWGQFYQDLQPLDPRFNLGRGFGDRLRMKKQGARHREVSAIIEDFFVRRRRSANQMVTHSDQQQRDPGSTGFIYVNQMVDKTLNLFDARN